MPQASIDTTNAYIGLFGSINDLHGLEYLEKKCKQHRGMFYGTPSEWDVLKHDEKAMVALDFLCEEWDYSYDFTGKYTPR